MESGHGSVRSPLAATKPKRERENQHFQTVLAPQNNSGGEREMMCQLKYLTREESIFGWLAGERDSEANKLKIMNEQLRKSHVEAVAHLIKSFCDGWSTKGLACLERRKSNGPARDLTQPNKCLNLKIRSSLHLNEVARPRSCCG